MEHPFIHNLDLKFGIHYNNESLNEEFKEFVFNKKDINGENRKSFDNFLLSGIPNQTVDDYIKNSLTKYVDFYVPKYTTCFFNTDKKEQIYHKDSFLLFGITDGGKITGIPINHQIPLNNLHSYLLQTLKVSINRNIRNNTIPLDSINSCIELHIYILKNDHIDSKTIYDNKKKIFGLDNEIDVLFKKIHPLKRVKNDLLDKYNKITTENYKKNPEIVGKYIDDIVDTNYTGLKFHITTMQQSTEIKKFLHNTLMSFTPDITFFRNYQIIYGSFDFKKFNDKTSNNYKALCALLHDKLREKSINDKKLINDEYKIVKNIWTEMDDLCASKIEQRDIIFYDISTHIDNIIKHNNLILIKIKFDNEKYKNITTNYAPSKIGFFDEKKGKIITTERIYKQKKENGIIKVDPECIHI